MNEQNQETIFETLLDYLRKSRGFDFTGYKRASLKRRVKKRMQVHDLEDFGDYLDYLEVHPDEFTPLFNTILINVTSFLRDRATWDYLRSNVIPHINAQKSPETPFRVWSAGSASGEEAYTIAIILAEELGLEQFRRRVKIYGTDVDEEALDQARRALYCAKALEDLPEAWRNDYFEPKGEKYQFRPDLRRSVIFGRHDLIQDAPMSHLDLLVCRNTLMYFNAETQSRILKRFNFALNNNSALFLGKAEMLLTQAELFTPLSLTHRIFTKFPKLNTRGRQVILSGTNQNDVNESLAENMRIRDAACDAINVAQIVVDLDNNLLLVNATAQKMFKLQTKDIGKAIQDLEISYRPLELRSHIEEVYRNLNKVSVQDVHYYLPDGTIQYLDVDFIPLLENNQTILGASITFTNVSAYHKLQSQVQQSNEELETTNEELQSSNEELETTNEELQSTNEELETLNEELHASNEELETMNEELHSTNEELQNLNDELRIITSDLDQANTFMHSILTSLSAGVIVVDHQYQIFSWNQKAEDLWGLRTGEVQGVSILGLDIGLSVAELREPILTCFLTGGSQKITMPAINRRGRSFQCEINFHPLLNGAKPGNRGVILLMEEVKSREKR